MALQNVLGNEVRDMPCVQDRSMLHSFKHVMDICADMFLSPWLALKFVRICYGLEKEYAPALKVVRGFFSEFIVAKKAAEQNTTERANIKVIDVVLDHLRQGTMSLETAVAECHEMIFAALITTTLTLSYALTMLAMYPEYQQQLFEEISSVFPQSGHFEVKADELKLLPYLDMVINETLRLMPGIPAIGRSLSKDLRLSNGIVLPKGLQVAIGIVHLHRCPKLWGADANKFNPENCSSSNLREKHPYAYLPFSKGKRNCIGWKYALMSVKIALIKLVRNYEFSTNERHEDMKFLPTVFMVPAKEPLLEIKKRV
ncbi:probable cytochrome P450 313a4 [Drosophila busckii]|nr:probable cytochrome P450 313a4 [Drosophila busckii]